MSRHDAPGWSAGPAPPQPVAIGPVSACHPLPNGIELVGGAVAMRVVALREDIVRVRMCVGGEWAEDASWVVLDAARQGSVAVEPLETTDAIGFRTASLSVRVYWDSGRLVVLDRAGRIVSEDAPGWPVTFRNGGFSVSKAIPAGEKYFGLGDKTGPLARNDQAFVLWNTDPGNFQESTDPIYKSIPFVIGMRGAASFGLLLDNTGRSHFDFGKRERDVFCFGAETGPLDYYIMVEDNPKRVVMAYAHLTGRPPMPPLWALGYQQSRYSYRTAEEVRAVAARLREERIPADAINLDIDFQDRFRPFTADPQRFPDFPLLIEELARSQFRVVAITDPHLPVVPGGGYGPYQSGVIGDHFVRGKDGGTFVGAMWGGKSAYPDFTSKQARLWWGGLYRRFVRDGVAGFWNDMNEPVVTDNPQGTMPLDAAHRIEEPGFASRTAEHREIHNIYGMLNTRATHEGLLALRPNRRPFVLTRATFAGGHRYAATWTGDNSATWNHLRLGVAMLLNLGLCGFALSGADIGGYFGSASPELLTRWFQIGAFMPLFRNHAFKESAAREPWVHGEPHTSIRRRFIEERYRLLPYLYTLAQEASHTGLPIMRPMFLEFPATAASRPWFVREPLAQFLLGPRLLVAPAPFPDMPDPYEVTLPGIAWYDYWTGERVPGSGVESGRPVTATVTPSLETIPVYVRGGAILPRQPVVQSTAEVPSGPLELAVYPGPKCHGSIYLDEGDGFRHRAGIFLRQRFDCAIDGETTRIRFAPRQGRHPPWWSEIALVVHDVAAAPASVSCSFGPVGEVRHDPVRRILRLVVPDSASGGEVVLVAPPADRTGEA
jgi:alpha-glucosidase